METTLSATKTKWSIDNAHSQIQFKVKHLMISTVTGNFGSFESNVETTHDDFGSAKISFSADISSVSTGNEQRDAHLKSADFFDVEKFPKIYFASSSIKKLDGDNYEVSGDLTLHGITKQVTLKVEFSGTVKDPWGNQKAGFLIRGKINRKDWGLTWNAALEAGGVMVSEDVRIECDVQLVKQQ